MSSELEKGLVTMLAGASPQTTAAGRVYPRLPQGVTFPAIRYQRIATSRNYSLTAPVGVTAATVQVDCMAETYQAAKLLADSVRVILNGYTGAFGTLTARHVSLEAENDFDEIDGDRIYHWVSQRYMIYTDMD